MVALEKTITQTLVIKKLYIKDILVRKTSCVRECYMYSIDVIFV